MDNQKNNRILYFDELKILSAFAVIVIHVSAQNWYSAKPSSAEWMFFTILDAASRWAVPIFVMISGALFLGKERGIKRIFKNNVIRMITAFAFWSALYVVADAHQGQKTDLSSGFKSFVAGHYHLWYLFIIAALYLLAPFLKKITEHENLTKYLLILSFIFSLALPFAMNVFSLFGEYWKTIIGTIIAKTNLSFVKGYVFYFVLGYYLSKKEISKKTSAIICISALVGVAVTVLLTYLSCVKLGKACTIFIENFTPACLLESIGVFIFFKNRAKGREYSERRIKAIKLLSKYTFGVYLSHVMVLEFLKRTLEINTMSFNSFAAVPLIILIVAAVSLCISAVLNQIPIVKKYIV